MKPTFRLQGVVRSGHDRSDRNSHSNNRRNSEAQNTDSDLRDRQKDSKQEQIAKKYDTMIYHVTVDPNVIDQNGSLKVNAKSNKQSDSNSQRKPRELLSNENSKLFIKRPKRSNDDNILALLNWNVFRPDSEPVLQKYQTVEELIRREKSRLDSCENIGKFSHQIRITSSLTKLLEAQFNVQCSTRATLKYIELIKHFEIVENCAKMVPGTEITSDKGPKPELRCFLNAELPGSLICILSHILKTDHNMEMNWLASSYIPSSSQSNFETKDVEILQLDDSEPHSDANLSNNSSDKFLSDRYGIYANNKERWLMGPSNNGDLRDLGNVFDLAKRVHMEFGDEGVDFYSSDAGIDSSDDFNSQEANSASIHLGAALCCFLSLRIGGSTILKQYIPYKPLSIQLIYIYSSLFERFFVTKPSSSGGTNSEIYLVGHGFKGLSKGVRVVLENKLLNFNLEPIYCHDDRFYSIYNFISSLTMNQCSYIDELVKLYNRFKDLKDKDLKEKLKQSVKDYTDIWLNLYPVRRIDKSDWIPSARS
jgi:23S rRNA U2552 (ribose-2'-O)-methylase RlmE/FtsJ